MRRGFRKVLLFVFVACVGLGLTAPALGETRAWWHLQLGEVPSQIQPGSARDEGQLLRIRANEGHLKFYDEQELTVTGEPAPEALNVEFDAKASVMQAALEVFYGKANVQVSSGE